MTNAFPNTVEKERGVFTYQIVNKLRNICSVEVIAPLPWTPKILENRLSKKYPFCRVANVELIDGIRVYHPRYLVIPKILGFLHPLFMVFPLLRLLLDLEKERKRDVINAHWLFPDGVAASWAARLMGKALVLTGLGCDINLYSNMSFRRPQIRNALKKANAITVVSSNMKKRTLELGVDKDKVVVIQNGIDTTLFRLMDKAISREILGLPKDSKIVVTVGSQDEVKGTKYLIEAFSRLLQNNDSKLLLVLVGDGPLRENLIRQVELLGISDQAIFVGKKPHSEIPLWLNSADVFCLPSIREGHPNVLIEAFACGIPVVASEVGAISEIVDDTNGKVAPAGDARVLYEKLKSVLQNKWDKDKIRRSVIDYRWEECSQKYIDVYSAVVARMNNK